MMMMMMMMIPMIPVKEHIQPSHPSHPLGPLHLTTPTQNQPMLSTLSRRSFPSLSPHTAFLTPVECAISHRSGNGGKEYSVERIFATQLD